MRGEVAHVAPALHGRIPHHLRSLLDSSSSLLVDLSGADPTRVDGEVELNGVRLTSTKDVVDGTAK